MTIGVTIDDVTCEFRGRRVRVTFMADERERGAIVREKIENDFVIDKDRYGG